MAESTVNHGNTENNTVSDGTPSQKTPEYVAFVLVPIFFLLGLLGILICHILKRKGYKCTTESEEEEEEVLEDKKDLEAGAPDLDNTFNDSNSDTVNQIVHYIMKNEANSDALKAMVHGNSVDSDDSPAWGPSGYASCSVTNRRVPNGDLSGSPRTTAGETIEAKRRHGREPAFQ
ncbi:hypothetical protein ANANG_G00140040 [Anguilla anguilla]|uniref:RELT-like protein 1 n=1 Tax=Anguilla anguilla TaxID=7936 RepID=A0A9D3MAK3_ANGAN|nr:hypothetical protein ANANG_G00140040 [Anguilla anguilla]